MVVAYALIDLWDGQYLSGLLLGQKTIEELDSRIFYRIFDGHL